MAGSLPRQHHGGVEKFDRLYTRYHREVLAYFVRRIPRQDAEDAASEVFAVAWRRIDHIPGGDQTVAWLFGVAHRVLANYRRGRGRLMRLTSKLAGLGGSAPPTPEAQVIRAAEDELLLHALDQLRPADKEVLRLATWEKLPYAAIGEVLGLSEAAVGQRVSRARKRLDKELDRVERRLRSRSDKFRKGGPA